MDDVVLYSANSSDCQMVLQTDHFADRRFRGSNWSLTEQLLKGCLSLINKQLDNAA